MEPAYIERDENKRQKYLKYIEKFSYKSVIFIDETGAYEYFPKRYGRALRGQKVYVKIHGKKGKRTNIIGAICDNKFISYSALEGTVNRDIYTKFIFEKVLPHVKEGIVVVMDNARIHKSDAIKKAIEEKGGELLYLPPYSPDFNPIEHCWALLKRWLRENRDRFSTLAIALKNYFLKWGLDD